MRFATLFVALAISLLAAITATADPTVTIYTDAGTYQSGDTIEVSLSAQNDHEAMSVAVYVGIILPDGDIWSTQYDGWRHLIEPWIPDIYVPAWFEMARTPFWSFDLPCAVPPVADPGDYAFAALLTYPGTFTYVSTASLAPFAVGSPQPSVVYVDADAGSDTGDGSEEDPWKTMTHALSSVQGSEMNPVTIHVAAGTYSASANGETFPLNMKSWVSMQGEDSEQTVLDGEGRAWGWEALIVCEDASSVCIERAKITGGLGFQGGGMYFSDSTSVIVRDCIIADNSATCGGAICCSSADPLIINCEIVNNDAGQEGGGISCWGSSPTIVDNVISGNSASGDGACGGGIQCNGSSGIIANNIFADNEARSCGGAIGCFSGSPTIHQNTIIGNVSGRGAGIDCYRGSSPPITNNVIAGNSARGWGGGIYCDWEGSSPDIGNNTIVENTADDGADGIYGAQADIIDCIIWGNGDDLYDCSATYCCIEDDDEGEGNIHDSPRFRDGPLGKYYLHPDSPCVDAGSRSAADAGLSDRTTQADGTPDTGTVDMGYHYPIP